MKKHFPLMQDCPEFPKRFVGLIYGVLAFFTLPFLMLVLVQGSFENEAVMNGVEIAYHVINGLLGLRIMWEYMQESFLYTPIDRKALCKTVAIGIGVMLLVANLEACLLDVTKAPALSWAFSAILPAAESDLFALSSILSTSSPILGTISLVLFSPVAISCLFYAVVFAPICCKKPWLAYAVMAMYLAFPRLCNGLTHWDLQTELILYFVQLPMHMIACWTYQKTNTIFAPILTWAIVNLLSCLYWIIPMLILG